jgi:hypothetical protein
MGDLSMPPCFLHFGWLPVCDAAREDIQIMQQYLPVIIPFLIGMGLFGLLRRRDTNPMLSGVAATFLSVVLVVAYFAFIITTGRV